MAIAEVALITSIGAALISSVTAALTVARAKRFARKSIRDIERLVGTYNLESAQVAELLDRVQVDLEEISAKGQTGVMASPEPLEDYFVRFLEDNQDQMSETELAEKLGISRKSLWERRQKLNVTRVPTSKSKPRRQPE